MSFELYLKNIKNLALSVGLKDPLELNEVLGATFVCRHKNPILVNINYDIEENQLTVDTLIATNMPSSRLGIQAIMNQLVGELLTQNKMVGKLVASPEEFAVKFVKKMPLKSCSEKTLADFIPVFVDAAINWQAKFKDACPNVKVAPTRRPETVLTFQYPI